MFHHVVNMAKEIGLTCVAEGVETSDPLDILRKNGCDIAQGFYYDKPLPVREFENVWNNIFIQIMKSQIAVL